MPSVHEYNPEGAMLAELPNYHEKQPLKLLGKPCWHHLRKRKAKSLQPTILMTVLRKFEFERNRKMFKNLLDDLDFGTSLNS